jgi:hypothetical protein
MHAVIRNYAGAPNLVSELTKRAAEVESIINTVPGFISYYLLKTNDGMVSVTVCESAKGCDESSRRASDWLRQNLPNLKIAAPQIISGELALKFATHASANA